MTQKKTQKQTPKKTEKKSEQNERPVKKARARKTPPKKDALLKLSPKKTEIEKEKKLFLEAMVNNHGIVTKALKASGLKRTLAYELYRTDEDFRKQWDDAAESAYDELTAEAWRRGQGGLIRKKFTKSGDPITDPETGEQYSELEFSDTLLIKLMNVTENKRKWREKVTKIGEVALLSIRKIGEAHKLPEETIIAIENEMLDEFDKVNLV